MKQIIGREEEKNILEHAFQSNEPEFIAVFGRRRVGKTYLIRNTLRNRENALFLNITGMKGARTQTQIKSFFNQIVKTFFRPGIRLDPPNNWYDAFDILAHEIKISPKEKIVLFFDEFPWMVTRKSEILIAFAYFWNQNASDDPRVKLIVCGSSAGWILKKIVNDRGALYNRVTQRIHLTPFTLYETKEYLTYKNITLNNQQIGHLYMVLGGIPFYLDQVKPGLSAIQVIADLAFKKNSFLLDEFENLYATLFDGGEDHIELARIIANHRYGIGQEELARKASRTSSGGTLVLRLKDLEKAGFVERYKPFSTKKRGVYYKMVDEYSLFYFRWIEPNTGDLRDKGLSKRFWERLQHSQAWHSWAGYAFESLCFKHIPQIMISLGLNELAIPHTWRHVAPKGSSETGAQIDLLFDRDDGLITVCEIKYTQNPFALDKAYAIKIANKLQVFEKFTKSPKQFFISFISANGLKETMYSKQMVSGVCTLDDLFKKAP